MGRASISGSVGKRAGGEPFELVAVELEHFGDRRVDRWTDVVRGTGPGARVPLVPDPRFELAATGAPVPRMRVPAETGLRAHEHTERVRGPVDELDLRLLLRRLLLDRALDLRWRRGLSAAGDELGHLEMDLSQLLAEVTVHPLDFAAELPQAP